MNERITTKPESRFVVVSVEELTLPLKRMLKMQFKEFVHHIEDAEDELGATERSSRPTNLGKRVA